MDEAKQEMIAIASMMAGKVVTASIDTSIQDALVEETLQESGKFLRARESRALL